MKAITKKSIENITVALSAAIVGETTNKKIKTAIDKSANKLGKKVAGIKKKAVKARRKADKKSFVKTE
ncbi:MAG: hypothetical protein ABI402_13650 [Ferruginibacter sp.]